MTNWLDKPTHTAWLDAEARRLLAFGLRVGLPEGGAAYLDAHGHPIPREGVATWLTARALYVYSLGQLLGIPGSGIVAERAMAGLTGRLRDEANGGWYPALNSKGEPEQDGAKQCYAHAFVMLAAASAVLAGRPGAQELLDEATGIFLDKFFDDERGLVIDGWDQGFTTPDDYRGLNSTMHSVEAMLAVADAVPADQAAVWRQRALRAVKFVCDLAQKHNGRLPEHFKDDWTPDLDLNRDQPNDQFKPYGATPGHGLEWARLILHLEAALNNPSVEEDEVRLETTGSLVNTARKLFDTAVQDAWAVDGADGFVYTTDWDGTPVVRQRMHWVLAEAIGAAAALYQRTGDQKYADWYQTFWDYAARYVLDLKDGSWIHELNIHNMPAATTWPGKPDLYHAVQAVLLPRVPLAPTLARALADNLLDTKPSVEEPRSGVLKPRLAPAHEQHTPSVGANETTSTTGGPR